MKGYETIMGVFERTIEHHQRLQILIKQVRGKISELGPKEARRRVRKALATGKLSLR